MNNHDYAFEFEGQRYVVTGTEDTVPDHIVLPDLRVVRVRSVMETYPAQIDEVEPVRSVPARKG